MKTQVLSCGRIFKLLAYVPLVISASVAALAQVQPDSLADGLVAYYPLDGDANDAGGSGINGILHNVSPTADRSGKPSAALSFQGVRDSYVDLGSPASLQFTGDFTVTAWVKFSGGATGNPRVFSYGADCGYEFLTVETTSNRHFGANLACVKFAADPTFGEGQWHFVAARRSGATATVFVNGSFVSTNTVSAVPVFSGNLNLGRKSILDPLETRTYWGGAIDEVRFYNRALSEEELNLLMAPTMIGGPFLNPANGHNYYLLAASSWQKAERKAAELGGHLVTINDSQENAWVTATFETFNGERHDLWIGLSDAQQEGVFTWASGEPLAYTNWADGQPVDAGSEDYVHIWSGTGGRWNDYVSRDLGGTRGVVEVPSPGTDCTAPPAGLVGWWPGDGNANDLSGGNNGILVNASTRAGYVGDAFAFSGQDSYVLVPSSSAIDAITSALTLEAWVWHETNPVAGQRYLTLTPDRAFLGFDTRGFNKGFVFSFAVAGTGGVSLTTDVAVEARKWYHVVGTYDGREQRLYVNGTQVSFAVVDRPLGENPASELLLSFPGGAGMNGLIDEAAIYNRALRTAEIQSHFAAGRAGMCKAPVLAGIETLFPGIARLSIKGQAGKDLEIFGSSNLVDWVFLTRIGNPTGKIKVDDPLAGTFKHRFYRAVMP